MTTPDIDCDGPHHTIGAPTPEQVLKGLKQAADSIVRNAAEIAHNFYGSPFGDDHLAGSRERIQDLIQIAYDAGHYEARRVGPGAERPVW